MKRRRNATDAALDHSLLEKPLKLGIQNVAQIAACLVNGTQEVKDLLLNECSIIYECRVCTNLFRSIANYIAHKRIYCKDHECERRVLYDPSWFTSELQKEHVPEMVVTNEDRSHKSMRNSKSKSINPKSSVQTNSQTFPLVDSLSETLNLSEQNVAQIAAILANGTEEVKYLLLNECFVIYECRVCVRSLFRSFANFLAHKRIYCKDHQCERMVLYDPSWFTPEQQKEHVPEMVVAQSDPSILNSESNSIDPTPCIQINSQDPSVVVPLSPSLTTSTLISIQMDHDSNQPAPTMDSSVSSSSGPIELNPATSDGPINCLPNKVMQIVMVKLGLDRDVKKLIRLRLVSTKWRAAIEDYCRMKKSLFVQFHPRAVVSKDYLRYFEKTFFGFTNFNNFTCLFVSPEIPSECFSSLLNMFPNIEQLSVDCSYCDDEPALDNSLEIYIKSLHSLKVLDLKESSISTQLSRVLSKLQHFSYNNSSEFGHNDDLLRLISHLGHSCVRVNFGQYFVYDQVLQWHSINPNWLANLTHLRMHIHRSHSSEDCAQVVHFLCKHAISLQHLEFDTFFYALKLTCTVLQDLGRLTYLKNVAFRSIEIDFPALEYLALRHQLPSLTSTSTCKLWVNIDDRDMFDYTTSGDQFTRVLSVIFPNLEELHLTFQITNTKRDLLPEMERHLGRFSNLHKHTIDVTAF